MREKNRRTNWPPQIASLDVVDVYRKKTAAKRAITAETAETEPWEMASEAATAVPDALAEDPLLLPLLELPLLLEPEEEEVLVVEEPEPEAVAVARPVAVPVEEPVEVDEGVSKVVGQDRLKRASVERLSVIANFISLAELESRRLYQKVLTLLKRRRQPTSSQ